jgi:hypothetical protein
MLTDKNNEVMTKILEALKNKNNNKKSTGFNKSYKRKN